jgi:hypothetical protein
MARCISPGDDSIAREAQAVVCGYLVRACQQAIYDLALEDVREPEVRRRAIAALREILADWREARNSFTRHDRRPAILLRRVNRR